MRDDRIIIQTMIRSLLVNLIFVLFMKLPPDEPADND